MVIDLITSDSEQAVNLMAHLEVQVEMLSLHRDQIASSLTSLEDQDGKLMPSLFIMNVCRLSSIFPREKK